MTSYIKRILTVLPLSFLLSNCDSGFEDMNVDPINYGDVVPEFMFSRALLDGVSNNYAGAAYLTIAQSMQHFATYKEVPAAGDKYFNFSYSTNSWTMYAGSASGQGAITSVNLVLEKLGDGPSEINKKAVARIWKAYLFHRMTDLYGDIPYFESGKALVERNFTPKYDSQKDIYDDLLKELDESTRLLDPAQGTFGNADLIYGGDVDKWRKFAYTLMLRLGMRLTEVDPAKAKIWVEKAIAGGVITSNADNATIEYVDGNTVFSRNFIATSLINTDYVTPGGDNNEGGKLARTFIDHLKSTRDPRLNVFSIVWVPTGEGNYRADTSTALQVGMPNAAYNSAPANFNDYSEPNPATLLSFSAPLIVLGSAESNLLLAEAAVRGWYGVDAAVAYEDAVGSALGQWAIFGSAGVISPAKIDAYLSYSPFLSNGTNDQKIEQISIQKWVSLFLEDEYEIFSNWRRTGYPVLTQTNYPGNLTGGQIPTRFVIPDSEELYNRTNFLEAKERQGGTNTLMSKVWWDN